MNRSPLVPLLVVAQLCFATCALAQWPNNPGTNVPVAVGPGNVGPPVVVPDGAGGAIALWADDRSGNADIYGQRLNAQGVPMWAANGVVLLGGYGNQANVVATSDGAGGVLVAYTDDSYGWAEDVLFASFDGNGMPVVYPSWIYAGPGSQFPVEICPLVGGRYCVSISEQSTGSADLWAATISAYGSVGWPYAMCTAAGDQYGGKVVPDAIGGAYIVWEDFRPGPSGNNIFAQHIDASGAPLWASNGLQVSPTGYGNNGFTAVGDGAGGLIPLWNDVYGGHRAIMGIKLDAGGTELTPTFWLATGTNDNFVSEALPDGEGGFFVCWSEYQAVAPNGAWVRVGRFTSSGVPQWSAATLGISSYAEAPRTVPDGEGGVFVTWRDYAGSSATYDPGVTQVTADGAVLGPWPYTRFSNANDAQDTPALAPDGRGGAIAVWLDARQFGTGNMWDLYAGRVAPFARLGNPEPRIVSVTDVMNDQGGRVSVRWNKSYLDKSANSLVSSYRMWRELPAPIAQAALDGGAKLFREPARAGAVHDDGAARESATASAAAPVAGERLIRHAAAGAWAGYWEYVGQQLSQGFASYSMTVATTGDSVPGSNPLTRFMVEAEGYSGHWEAEPATGYSVDNLGPAQPAPFAAVFGGTSTALHWAANTEADLAGYRLYRGTTASFVPGPATFVADVGDTNYVDVISQPRWYKLVAVDAHGNTSPAALAASSGLLDVAPGAGAALALSRPSPNPARGAVTLRFALPAAGAVRLTVLDAQGRVVRTLAEGERAAGEHALAWDRRGEGGGRAAPGLYFVRLQAAGRVLTERVAIID